MYDIATPGSMRRDLKLTVRQHIRNLMLEIASDPLRCAEVVGAGPFHFRQAFLKVFKGMPVNDDIANKIFAFVETKFESYYPLQSAKQVLDAAFVPSPERPPTEAEIDAAWEFESASDPQFVKEMYGDLPSGVLANMKFHRH